MNSSAKAHRVAVGFCLGIDRESSIMTFMNIEALIDELEEEAIEDALRMSDEQKLLAGARLFEYACAITLSGIKADHPDWTHEQALQELNRRVQEQDEFEDAE
jgi:hypothetical protein